VSYDLTAPILTMGPQSVTLTAAIRLHPDDKEVAWSGPKARIRNAPDRAFFSGRYVHGGLPANRNGHIFKVEDLRTAHEMVPNTYVNVLHRPKHIMGTFVDTVFVEPATVTPPATVSPDDAAKAAAEFTSNPYVDALAMAWRWAFPQEYADLKKAHDVGQAFLSMETVPETVTCATCNLTVPYAGPRSDTYDAHMNQGAGMWLNNPLFLGGAAVIPPGEPGWSQADVTQLEVTATLNPEEAEEVHRQVAALCPHLSTLAVEGLTSALVAAVTPHGDQPKPVLPTAKADELMGRLLAGEDAGTIANDMWEATASGEAAS
jgi:hypothetical protein